MARTITVRPRPAGKPPANQIERPTGNFETRYAAGKTLRGTCPRESHAALDRVVRSGRVKAVFEEAI